MGMRKVVRIALNMMGQALFGAGLLVAAEGCGGTEEEVCLSGCDRAEQGSLAEVLESRFPGQAGMILNSEHAFVPSEDGFATTGMREDVQGVGSWKGGVRMRLSRRASEPVRFDLGSGVVVQVREEGASGDAELVGNAVAYQREGGFSFWTAMADGYEEWLLLDAGLAYADRPVASWQVEGGRFRQIDEAVEVISEEGQVLLVVTAPNAYAPGGREVQARLEADETALRLFADAAGEPVLVDPYWAQAAAMPTARGYHTATLLADKSVLVAGGAYVGSSGSYVGLTAPERYFPAWNLWKFGYAPAFPMTGGRYLPTATLLDDGRVIVAGGHTGSSVLSSVVLYDPVKDVWTVAPSMATARYGHTATKLNDGRVLVAGGYTGSVDLNSVEIYNPSSNTWSAGPPLAIARRVPTATLLQDGRVLVAGGVNSAVLASAEVYNPAVNGWTVSVSMNSARYYHSATLLADGRVLVVGGYGSASLSSVEYFNPSTNSWSPGPSLPGVRHAHSATRLGNNNVLVVGGGDGTNYLSSALMWSAISQSWVSAPFMAVGRAFHSATLLDSGEVLIAGGFVSPTVVTASVERCVP